jgi:hypothetical protein
MATTPTINPSPTPSVDPNGSPKYQPIPHKHDYSSITGLRFGTNGRVEPVYDSADVYANNQIIALYTAATDKAKFTQTPVGPVTVQAAVQNNDAGSPTSEGEGKKQADEFLKEGKITQKEYDTITKDVPASGPGVAPSTQTVKGTDSQTFADTAQFTYDTVLTPGGTTLGAMINKVTFPRTIAQLAECYPGMKAAQVVSNLAALAQNIVEPLKRQFPKAFLTNSYRHGATIGGGQHGTGQACDIQFHGVHSSGYFDIAVWMSKNLPYDQLLLEYLPGKTVWVHVSYAVPGLPNGGISVTQSKPQNRLATLNGASGGKFTPNLHADIIENAGINRIVAG